MITITLKDNSTKEIEKGTTILDLAKSISEGLARVATCAKVNDKICDLRDELNEDANVEILTFDSEDVEGKKAYWHTTSHIMAQAIKRIYGDKVKLTIGPSIDNGFYYDFDSDDVKFSADDFEKIEEEMKKIIKENIPIERYTLSRDEAIKFEKEQDEPYKVELINDLPQDAVISFYKQGDFTDLCAGPHLMSTGKVGKVKLLTVSGAYWRGSEDNKMIQRIYAISFPKKEQLDEYIAMVEDAKERDHRKIGKDMRLFMTDPLVGAGLPMFLPDGTTVKYLLEEYIRNKETKMGYKHVATPSLATTDLYKTSGHWDHYKDDMFPVMKMDNEEYVLRPMNCPHHMLIYRSQLRSYKDLPIRIAEIAHDFRYENSGAVLGLERVRQMTQNDSHIFVRPDQIKDEVGNIIKLIKDVYINDFHFPEDAFKYRLSLRDKADKKKYIDNDEMWDTAEEQLRKIMKELNLNFYEAKGEAAFYGPKIDIQIKTALNHDVTIPTCQLDFALPERFDLKYIGEDGEEHRPVVIHRAVLGSSERFMAFLIEETKGNFPTWLAPHQVAILPISEKHIEYANKIKDEMEAKGIRASVDDRNEKVGYKIREAEMMKIPYMLVVGDKEVESNTVSVRKHGSQEMNTEKVDEFVENIVKEIEEKA